MKNKFTPEPNICSELRKEYFDHFKTGEPQYRSFHDLLWQIHVNKMTEDSLVLFHVNVEPDGNKLVIAYESGGYKNTGVVFTSENYNECCDIVEKINERFFGYDTKEQSKIIAVSMQFSKS
jgi:hypothetical protein